MILRISVLWLAALIAGSAECLPVRTERILAADMAKAVPAFAGIAPETPLGYAPSPGASRTYAPEELARLARRYGLMLEPGQSACFVRAKETLSRERVAAALQAAMPEAHVEVLDFSHQPVPTGDLRFEPFTAGTQNEVLWHGAIRGPGRADFPVWAKGRIRVLGTRTIAAEPLPPGQPITRSQVRAESYEGPPGLPDPAQVVGRVPRRFIPAGKAVQLQWLEDPAEVQRGERVQVEVLSGRAHLLLEGQAQSSGRRGQVIPVRNPANGKIFRATIEDRGRVALVASPSGMLASPGEVQ